MLNHPSAVVKNSWQNIPYYIKVTFFSALFIGLLTHIFMLTNKLPNHDELYYLVHNMKELSASGRWFLPYPTAISSVYSIPLINGLLAVVYISLAACAVVSCLKIYDTFYCMLVSGLMVSMPTVACTFTYMQQADGFFFSLMLACFSAWLTERYRYGFIAAVIPLVLSLGIYQAYYAVTASLLVIILIFEVLNNQVSWQKTMFKGFRFAAALAVAMLFYFGMVKLTMPARGLSSYMGINKMGQIPLTEIPNLIARAYRSIWSYFFQNSLGFHYQFMPVLFTISFLLCALLLTLWCVRQKMYKEPIKLVLLMVLLLMLPLSCNIVYLMNPRDVHTLMIYSTVFLLIFLLAVTALYLSTAAVERGHDTGNKKSWLTLLINMSCWFVTITVTLCIFNYGVISNKAYFKLFFTYEQTYAQSVELLSRIRGAEGYTRDSEIVLVGDMRRGLSKNYRTAIRGLTDKQFRNLTGVRDNDYLFGSFSYANFLRHYLGFTQKIEYISNGVLRDPDIAVIVAYMPEYPARGSVAMIANKIYVKFSSRL